jgi:hypothetical protein
MKKVVLVLTLVLGTLVSKAQTTKTNSVSMYYGRSNTIGVNTNLNKFGFGISFGVKGPVGRDYSQTMGPNAFSEDIYEVVNAKNIGLKVMYGDYIFPKTKVSAVLGYGSYKNYYNAYDKYQILDPSGYYFTSTQSNDILIYGFNINQNIISPKGYMGIGMGLEVGYNNFDNIHLGVSLDF